MSEQAALVVPLEFFGRQPAHALDETAFDLAAIDAFVNGVTRIVQDVGAQNTMQACEAVHLNFRDRRAISEIMEGFASTRSAIPMDAGGSIIPSGGQADAFEVGLLYNSRERDCNSW